MKDVPKGRNFRKSLKKQGNSKEAKGIKGVPAFQVRQPQPMQVHRDIFSYT